MNLIQIIDFAENWIEQEEGFFDIKKESVASVTDQNFLEFLIDPW